MQLLNSPATGLPDAATKRLLDALQDIVSKVQIQSNFCISHPNYQLFELPTEVVARFGQQVPMDVLNRYRSLQLCSNLTNEGAVTVMTSLTQLLNAIPIPFTFKVL